MTVDKPQLFACCDHCGCSSSDRTGHEGTCRIYQNADGTLIERGPRFGADAPREGCER